MGELASLTVLVDGGASGCRLQARDTEGRVCAVAQSGPASLSLAGELTGDAVSSREPGQNQAWQNILAGLAEISLQTGNSGNWRPQQLVMGLAGALHVERRKQLLALAQEYSSRVTLVTDGHAQLLGASGGSPGACLAVGTGSVLHWIRADGTQGMAGGWGFPAGDEASGAWLGLLAVNYFTRWYDAHGANSKESMEEDPFYLHMRGKIGTEITDIQTWSTCKSPTQLATLAPELIKLLEYDSEIARDIVGQGTRALEQLLNYAPTELPLFFAGGLARTYLSRLAEPWSSRLKMAHGDVFDGLWHLARKI